MFKSQQVFVLGLLTLIGLLYNNCSSKVQFSTTPPLVNAFGATAGAPGTSVSTPNPVLPSSPVLTFNDLNQPATIAFNDNYPEAGDSDYNDFVVNVNVNETYDSKGNLTKIVIQYTPKYKISGADHKFVLCVDGQIRGRGGVTSNLANFISQSMFDGDAKISFNLVNSKGVELISEENHEKSKDLVIYNSTAQAMADSQVATISITNISGPLNTYEKRGALSIKRYRSVLFNGSYDIDISDIDPAFVDRGNAPVGFFVPVNWIPPGEGKSIFPAYPEFRAHANYLMSGAPLDGEPLNTSHWFKTIGDTTSLAN